MADLKRKGRAAEESQKPKLSKGWVEEELALDGRLLELDDPVLLHIARQADLRTQLAMEGTCRRLHLAAKEAGDLKDLRQISVSLEPCCVDGEIVKVDFLLSGGPSVSLSRGVRVQLSGPLKEGKAKPRPRPFLKALVEHLHARGARPTAFQAELFFEDIFKGAVDLLRFFIDQVKKKNWLSKPKSLSFGFNEAGATPMLLQSLMDSSELVGFSSEAIYWDRPPKGLWPCVKLLYLRLHGVCLFEWVLEAEDGDVSELVKVLCQLRLLVVAGPVAEQPANAFVEEATSGLLQLRRQYQTKLSHQPALNYAAKDFHPDELKPLHLSHIWDLELS